MGGAPDPGGHFLGKIEQPVAISDLMPFDQLAETEFYRTSVASRTPAAVLLFAMAA
jgi:hypothetical protein